MMSRPVSKGMQFDAGAPHGFLDFRFRVDDAGSGEFWLPYCGALMDVEPMGEEFVVGMCHHIEDPTFDATAAATNPRAQIRPLHRPPRQPADRVPHCHWQVRVEPEAQAVTETALAGRVRASRLAQLVLPASPPSSEPDGLLDYAGPFNPDLEFEDLAQSTLVTVCQEFCVQGHLLVRSFMMAIAERWGDSVAREIATHQWIGVAGVAAERIAAAMHVEGDDLGAIARLLQIHPAFHPCAYFAFHVDVANDEVRCRIDPCPASSEGDSYTWVALPADARHRAVDAMVRVINPQARTRACEAPEGSIAWAVRIDADAEPAPKPPEVGITKLSKGSSFRFASRRPGDGGR